MDFFKKLEKKIDSHVKEDKQTDLFIELINKMKIFSNDLSEFLKEKYNEDLSVSLYIDSNTYLSLNLSDRYSNTELFSMHIIPSGKITLYCPDKHSDQVRGIRDSFISIDKIIFVLESLLLTDEYVELIQRKARISETKWKT